MKKILLIILCFSIITLATAQPVKDQEITSAVEALRKAMLDGNKTALENLTSPDLTYGHSSGLMEDKAAFVEAIASGKNNFTSIELSELTVKFTGGIAMVRHKLKGELTNNGTPAALNIGVLQIWQKEKGKWRMVARQAYKL
jgi:Domain of unknown function (DUF4440)